MVDPAQRAVGVYLDAESGGAFEADGGGWGVVGVHSLARSLVKVCRTAPLLFNRSCEGHRRLRRPLSGDDGVYGIAYRNQPDARESGVGARRRRTPNELISCKRLVGTHRLQILPKGRPLDLPLETYTSLAINLFGPSNGPENANTTLGRAPDARLTLSRHRGSTSQNGV